MIGACGCCRAAGGSSVRPVLSPRDTPPESIVATRPPIWLLVRRSLEPTPELKCHVCGGDVVEVAVDILLGAVEIGLVEPEGLGEPASLDLGHVTDQPVQRK